MNQNTANLMVAVFDHSACVKIKGRADFTSSVDLKKLITELWRRGYNHFAFELCDCVTMDSTFLGMLSGIALKLIDTSNAQASPLELINPCPRIAEVLENLGVAHLFRITSGAGPVSNHFEPLAKGCGESRAEIARTCLEAHKTLMGIKPENVPKFKDVAEFLAEDLQRLEMEEKK
jgi:anti-sigma B factor antagonist